MAHRPSRQEAGSEESQWLSLGPAARFLGVSEETLRHWADTGQVRSYRTPGAHRRFGREDLERLLESGLADLPQDLEDQALQRLRRRFRNPPASQTLPVDLDETARERLRVLGRRLLEVALRYHQDRRHRSQLREEARFLGQEYGAESIRLGLSISQALSAFLHHRSVAGETVQTLIPAGASVEEALGLARDMTDLVDVVLLALCWHYEEARAPQQQDAHETASPRQRAPAEGLERRP